MGDDGEVYDMFTPKLCQLMKKLALKADIITPNLTELCLLTDSDYEKIHNINEKERLIEEVGRLVDIICEDVSRTVIVTGLHYVENGILMMGNLAFDQEHRSLVGVPKIGGVIPEPEIFLLRL